MGTWMQSVINSATFLGAGGTPMGAPGGGPSTAGVAANQALPDVNGQLRMNYSSGCSSCGTCNALMPPDESDAGVQNDFLVLNWLPVVC